MEQTNQIFKIDNTILNDFKKPTKEDNLKIIFIVLNYELNYGLIKNMKKISDLIFVGDGGANRLYNLEKDKETKIIPQYIIGDMDSIDSSISKFYENQGSVIYKSDCQDSTDLDKVMTYFDQNIRQENTNYKIYVTGALGGRIDHTLTNMSNLQKYQMQYQGKNVLFQLIDQHSLCSCIVPGQTTYIKSEIENDQGVGVLPLAQTDKQLRTKGLKWDICEEIAPLLQFGSFLSSSNEFKDNVVEIENTQPIIFTTSMNLKQNIE